MKDNSEYLEEEVSKMTTIIIGKEENLAVLSDDIDNLTTGVAEKFGEVDTNKKGIV